MASAVMGLNDGARAVADVTSGPGRPVANGASGPGDGVAGGAARLGDSVTGGTAGLGDGVAALGQILADGLGLDGERARSDQAGGEHCEAEGHAGLLRRTDRPGNAPDRATLPPCAAIRLASAEGRPRARNGHRAVDLAIQAFAP
jgi:hypothetical protein